MSLVVKKGNPQEGVAFFNKTAVLAWSFLSESEAQQCPKFVYGRALSKGKESLQVLYENAVALLDLSYTRDDLTLLLEDARSALERKSVGEIQESLDLFVELLDFEPLHPDVLERNVRMYAGPKRDGSTAPAFEHLILFEDENQSLGLKKGPFSPQGDLDLAWLIEHSRGEVRADLEGMEVFEFLAELAMKRTQDGQAEK